MSPLAPSPACFSSIVCMEVCVGKSVYLRIKRLKKMSTFWRSRDVTLINIFIDGCFNGLWIEVGGRHQPRTRFEIFSCLILAFQKKPTSGFRHKEGRYWKQTAAGIEMALEAGWRFTVVIRHWILSNLGTLHSERWAFCFVKTFRYKGTVTCVFGWHQLTNRDKSWWCVLLRSVEKEWK